MTARTPIALRLGDCAERAHSRRSVVRRAFSLVELLVVMAVVVMLTALMMPAMQQLRENAQRVVCMSNMQQLGHAFFMFAADNEDYLPDSELLTRGESPQDLMMARSAGFGDQWDGLGLLFRANYCEAPECFYCPSHHGDHPYERYAKRWSDPSNTQTIYTNYHYAGHMEWTRDSRRRNLADGNTMVLLTDGLRTATDFNHVFGMNALRGDGSVSWREDTTEIYKLLPLTEHEEVPDAYLGLWDLVQAEK